MSNDQMALRQSHSTGAAGRWFELSGDTRLGRCATEGCGGQPAFRLETDGIGSEYCSGCAAKIRSLSPVHKDGEAVAWVTADILAAMKRGERVVPGWKRSDDFCIPLYTHPKEAEVTAPEEMVKGLMPSPAYYSDGWRVAHSPFNTSGLTAQPIFTEQQVRAALVAAERRGALAIADMADAYADVSDVKAIHAKGDQENAEYRVEEKTLRQFSAAIRQLGDTP